MLFVSDFQVPAIFLMGVFSYKYQNFNCFKIPVLFIKNTAFRQKWNVKPVAVEMDEDALCPEECKKSVENLFLRIPRLGKILGQNPGVSVVPDAADQIDRA